MSPTMGTMLMNEVVPRLKAAARSVPKVGADDNEELVADMTVQAARMMDSADKADGRVAMDEAGDGSLGLHEIVWQGDAADPAEDAARNLDWAQFLESHPPRIGSPRSGRTRKGKIRVSSSGPSTREKSHVLLITTVQPRRRPILPMTK